MQPSKQARSLDRAAAGLWSLLVAWIAAHLWIPGLSRPFWEDEIHHNFGIISAPTIASLREQIAPLFQPILDFLLRRFVWFPVFGHEELGLRLPALICSLLLVIAVILLAYRVLADALERRWLALLFLIPLGAWITLHPMIGHYAAEARHYAFASFLSVLWCYAAFFRPRRDFAFWCLTFLCMNTHFFFLPMILPVVGWGSVEQVWKTRKWREPIGHLVLLVLLGKITFMINGPAYHGLKYQPPGQGAESWSAAFAGGLEIWTRLFQYLHLPAFPFGSPWVLWLPLLVGVMLGQRKKASFTALILLYGVFPLFFAYTRHRSNYPFGDRYFTPWFGLGWVACVLGALNLLELGKRLAAGYAMPRIAVPSALAGLFIIANPGFYAFVPELGKLAGGLPSLPRNQSSYFRIYDELKAIEQPIFLIHSHCWTDNIPTYYRDYVGNRPRSTWRIADSVGCQTLTKTVRDELTDFLKLQPNGVVVLDQKTAGCGKGSRPFTSRAAETMEHIRSVSECVWLLRGFRKIGDIERAAQAIGFNYSAGTFGP